MKNLCNENHKTLKKEFEDTRGENLPCSWTDGINGVKMVILLKAICISNAIPTKIPMSLILIFVWKH
jgi:hypothetical protein